EGHKFHGGKEDDEGSVTESNLSDLYESHINDHDDTPEHYSKQTLNKNLKIVKVVGLSKKETIPNKIDHNDSPNENKLIQKEIDAFKSWSDDDYFEIREQQKAGPKTIFHLETDTKIKEIIKNMENGFEKLDIHEGPMVRGISTTEKFEIGDIFTTEAFSSFSSDLESWFSLERNTTLLVEKNKSGKVLKDYASDPNEEEVLIKKGTKYKIKSVTDNINYNIWQEHYRAGYTDTNYRGKQRII
ncbi:unnamed protein product, partial [marine sediment metagenome]